MSEMKIVRKLLGSMLCVVGIDGLRRWLAGTMGLPGYSDVTSG
jgi:hypothetical protein